MPGGRVRSPDPRLLSLLLWSGAGASPGRDKPEGAAALWASVPKPWGGTASLSLSLSLFFLFLSPSLPPQGSPGCGSALPLFRLLLGGCSLRLCNFLVYTYTGLGYRIDLLMLVHTEF